MADERTTSPPVEIEVLREVYDFIRFCDQMNGPMKFAASWLPKAQAVLRPHYAHEGEEISDE